jgi:cysteine-rich repeat protein
MRRSLLLLAAVIGMSAGCIGTDDGPDPFRNCGNGVVEGKEDCDDANAVDNDDCLGSCMLNVCGDEFVNTAGPENIEECDGRFLNNATCRSLGFAAGTLACSVECTFDTSGCTLPPGPTPTATLPAGALP